MTNGIVSAENIIAKKKKKKKRKKREKKSTKAKYKRLQFPLTIGQLLLLLAYNNMDV